MPALDTIVKYGHIRTDEFLYNFTCVSFLYTSADLAFCLPQDPLNKLRYLHPFSSRRSFKLFYDRHRECEQKFRQKSNFSFISSKLG